MDGRLVHKYKVRSEKELAWLKARQLWIEGEKKAPTLLPSSTLDVRKYQHHSSVSRSSECTHFRFRSRSSDGRYSEMNEKHVNNSVQERAPQFVIPLPDLRDPTLRSLYSKLAMFRLGKVHPSPTAGITKVKTATRTGNRPERRRKTHGRKLKPVLLKVLLGVPVCHCISWTVWLLLLNFAPNDIINGSMHTGTFDEGSFWLLLQAPPVIVMLATFGLVIVAALYITILVKIVQTKQESSEQGPMDLSSPSRFNSIQGMLGQVLTNTGRSRKRSKVVIGTVKLAAALADKESRARKIFKLWLKVGDLVIEFILLYGMLEAGSPNILIVIFTGIVTLNALSCAVMMFLPLQDTVVGETLVDITFDAIVAVEYPVVVFFYALSAFKLNRAQLAINMEVFPSGSFEREVRVAADPVLTEIVDQTLRSLRIMSALDLVTRIAVNLTLCFRLHDAVKLIHDPKKQRGSLYPKRHYLAAGFFVLFSVFLVAFVYESMRTSSLVCEPHPECVMHARRWTMIEEGSSTQCPCLILIDQDTAPKSYAEWLQPKNVTEKVAHLATRGDLQGIFLTNRLLPVLPQELQRCSNMKRLSLQYTHTQTLPAWIKEYTKLEFLHIESKMTNPMASLPEGMFDDMASLTFMHFSSFIPMTQLPSFSGLSNLKSLTLTILPNLEELPSFDHLFNLERLVLSSMPMLHTLPDFGAITELKAFTSTDRGEWCCNGFLGECNLANPLCQPHAMWGSPAAKCLLSNRTENVASPATLAALKNFSSTTCGPVLQLEDLNGSPVPESVDMCNGTLWKRCHLPGALEAMCYSERFMIISCTRNPFAIKMRRLQIERGVGDPCDPKIEAWLGCN